MLVFYRAYVLAGDTAPIEACADALARKGARVLAVSVTSLKDPAAAQWIRAFLARERPDVILNSTGFAARTDADESPLEVADAPIFQMIHAGSSRAAWENDPRGLSAADIAMNVVLPEIDGRIITRPISFKEETARSEALEFTRLVHRPVDSRIDFVADLALAWAICVERRATNAGSPAFSRIIRQRQGAPAMPSASIRPRALRRSPALLAREGYAIDPVTDPGALMRGLAEGKAQEFFALGDYRAAFAALPEKFREAVPSLGRAGRGCALRRRGFSLRSLRLGTIIVAMQPDRARSETRKATITTRRCRRAMAISPSISGCAIASASMR